MAVTSRAGKASHLGDAVGLSDEQLLEMFRLVSLARAVDERMWILNRAGRIPFVISGPGPRRGPGRDRLGAREEEGLDRAVLPLDRDLPDVRDECPGHPHRAVRDRHRPVLRWPPDARPLRQPRAQPRLRLVAGCDPAPPRGRDRPRGEDPQDRPGGDDHDGRGQQQPGRRPRGSELRGHPQAAVHLRRREQRLRDQRADGPPGRGHERLGAGGRLRNPRACSSTAPTSSPVTRRLERPSSGPGRGRARP